MIEKTFFPSNSSYLILQPSTSFQQNIGRETCLTESQLCTSLLHARIRILFLVRRSIIQQPLVGRSVFNRNKKKKLYLRFPRAIISSPTLTSFALSEGSTSAILRRFGIGSNFSGSFDFFGGLNTR